MNFAQIVARQYGFLAALGFSVSESLPTIVRYRKGSLEVTVYHGRQSYEVGFEVGHGDEMFSISELIRIVDPVAARKYRNYAARTSAGVESAVDQLANLTRRYGERALADDPQTFLLLRQQRKTWAQDYALDALARQTRPKADAAFRAGRYKEAAEMFERMASRLTPTEQKKLAVARKKI